MKKNINLVSILIINYNNAKYIDRAIKSCLNQTYKNIEILIFDDISKDNSKKKILKYKNNKKIKYYFNNNKCLACVLEKYIFGVTFLENNSVYVNKAHRYELYVL